MGRVGLNMRSISQYSALAAGGLRHTQIWSMPSSDQKCTTAELLCKPRAHCSCAIVHFLTQLDAPAFLAAVGHSARRGARPASSGAWHGGIHTSLLLAGLIFLGVPMFF